MKKIQIEVDKDNRTAALFVNEKLVTFRPWYDWGSFSFGEYEVSPDVAFIAYLNATACETEEELNHFIPSFDGNKSKEKLDYLRNYINNFDNAKVRTVKQSVAVIFRNKLFFFKRENDGYKIGDNILDVSTHEFSAYCSAAICETDSELELSIPMLEAINPKWNEHTKYIRKHMEKVLGQKRGIFHFFHRLISCIKRLL